MRYSSEILFFFTGAVLGIVVGYFVFRGGEQSVSISVEPTSPTMSDPERMAPERREESETSFEFEMRHSGKDELSSCEEERDRLRT